MTSLTININDALARVLRAEAKSRRISVEQVATERIATSLAVSSRKPTPARPPIQVDDPERVIGSFADRPDLLDNVLVVLEDRSRRYGSA